MEDQVMALKKLGVEAEMLNADTPKAETTRILNVRMVLKYFTLNNVFKLQVKVSYKSA